MFRGYNKLHLKTGDRITLTGRFFFNKESNGFEAFINVDDILNKIKLSNFTETINYSEIRSNQQNSLVNLLSLEPHQ